MDTNDDRRSSRPKSAVVPENPKKLYKIVFQDKKIQLREIDDITICICPWESSVCSEWMPRLHSPDTDRQNDNDSESCCSWNKEDFSYDMWQRTKREFVTSLQSSRMESRRRKSSKPNEKSNFVKATAICELIVRMSWKTYRLKVGTIQAMFVSDHEIIEWCDKSQFQTINVHAQICEMKWTRNHTFHGASGMHEFLNISNGRRRSLICQLLYSCEFKTNKKKFYFIRFMKDLINNCTN